MIIIAVLKHIASKNADYGDAIRYLVFQHDEIKKKPIKDENGHMIMREEYYLEGINCEPMSFDKECEILNSQYHKNSRFDEIKTHHYIISFDPKDKEECGLTGKKAQALGMEYAKSNFPGHQAIVCTHVDGHNGSGNIHVHIVINSLRKYPTPEGAFTERKCDSRAGYKHNLTKNYLLHLQKSLMGLCQRENLHQVDLLTPSTCKVTEKEYWAKRRGQKRLDKVNEEIIAEGLTPRKTVYQTQKQFLRDSIEEASKQSTDIESFKKILLERFHITVTDKRGRFSYLHPDRTKNITGHALGTHYEKDYLEKYIMEKDSVKKEEKQEEIIPGITLTSMDYHEDPLAIFFVKSDLKLVVDLQSCVKAQQSRAYKQKVMVSNLKQMAKTLIYIQEQNIESREILQSEYTSISQQLQEVRKKERASAERLKDLNEQIHYSGQYLSNKAAYSQFLKSRSKKNFRSEHSTEIQLYEEAVKYLKVKHPDGKFPSMKSLKAEKEKVSHEHNSIVERYEKVKKQHYQLHTICMNVDSILQRDNSKSVEKGISQDMT